MSLRNLSVAQRDFIRYFLESGNASNSARLAGYKNPGVIGPRLKKSLRLHIESEEVKKELEKMMPPHEALEILAKIARGETPKHREQLKAIELVLRSHGVLSDKIQVTLDRKALMAQVTDYIRRLRVVDIEARALPEAPSIAVTDQDSEDRHENEIQTSPVVAPVHLPDNAQETADQT